MSDVFVFVATTLIGFTLTGLGLALLANSLLSALKAIRNINERLGAIEGKPARPDVLRHPMLDDIDETA